MNNKQSRLLEFWPLFFLLVSLEAAACLIALLQIPSGGADISAARWALLLPLLMALVASAYAIYISWRNPGFRRRWLDPDSKPGLYKILFVIFPTLGAITGIGSFLLRWWEPDRLLPLFERAWPLLAFVIVFSIQSTIWLLIMRFGIHKVDFPATVPTLVAFAILIIVFVFVSLTKLGVTPDPAYWGEPGVPIQGWQLGLALVIGASFLPLSLLLFFNSNPRRTDFILCVFIWALAAWIWSSVPNEVLKNSFYFPIDPPANMPLPYSDSGYYDYMAQSLLIGTDYIGEVPTRPLYIVLLTVLHLLFGENYNLIILGQTLVLASFPVVLYLLGRKLHSRLAGLTIALLAIFREWTNLLVSSDTRVSNTKSLLVDIPTLLLILLACLFVFRWLERKDKRSAFIAGATFGILLLLRTQTMLILPILFVIAFLAFRADKRPWLLPLLLFTLGVAISVTPWLTHNYLRMGRFAFDAPFQYQLLASQYAYTGNLEFAAIDLGSKSLGQILILFALKDPRFVAGFITNHFLATEIGAILALPLIFPFGGLRAPVNLYWTSFNGTLAWNNSLMLISYFAFIAIGLGSSWRRWRWVGLTPLAFNLGYALANGIGRFSGWRYDLPADWIAYFYFGVGFAEILFWMASIFGSHPWDIESNNKMNASRNKRHLANPVISLAIMFAVIGALPWIAESINSAPRYPDLSTQTIQEQMTNQPAVQDTGISSEEIRRFADQAEAVALTGRLLYPRFFGRSAGLSSTTPWQSYAPRDFPRLGFLLINQKIDEVVFPIKGGMVENVHGEDVLILGCKRKGYIEARILVFPSADLAYLSNLVLMSCSP